MLVVLAAVGSALAYGSSDFLAGWAARRGSVLRVTTLTYAVGTAVLGLVVLAAGGDLIAGLAAGSVAGVFAAVGLVTFYAALAAGPMGVLSPVIAMLQAAVPVLAALTLGDRLGAWQWAGVAAALVATALLGTAEAAGTGGVWSRRAAVLALVSGVALGLSVVALDAAPARSGLTPGLVELAVGLALLLGVLAAARTALGARLVRLVHGMPDEAGVPDESGAVRPGVGARGVVVPAAGAGVLMAAAQGLLVVALHGGELAVVAVLVGLYPVATVLLARVVLGERLTARGLVGVVAAVVAGVLLGAA